MEAIFISNPVYLWLLVLIPLYIFSHFFYLHRTHKKAMRFANFQTLRRVDGKRHLVRNYSVLVLRVLTLLCLVLIISGVSVQYFTERDDFDYMLVLDTSPSMIANDVTPSRFEAAKMHASSFLNFASGDVGLLSYSAVTQVHHTLGSTPLDIRLTLGTIPLSRASGTDPSSAIITAVNLLTLSERGKAIILFTDGLDSVSPFMDDDVALQYAREQGVVIHTVGYGTSGASLGYLPDIYNLTSVSDRERLVFLAEQTGGQALFPESNQEVDVFFDDLTSSTSPYLDTVDLNTWGIIIILILLSIEWVLINTRFRRVV